MRHQIMNGFLFGDIAQEHVNELEDGHNCLDVSVFRENIEEQLEETNFANRAELIRNNTKRDHEDFYRHRL